MIIWGISLKNYRNSAKRRIPVCVSVSEKTGMPFDTISGYPQITVSYGRQICVEGKCRISEYTSEVLKLRCKGVCVLLEGKNIRVKLMDDEALVAVGAIKRICFEE